MKSTLFPVISAVGLASFILSGCYTQLATVEDRYEGRAYYEREAEQGDDSLDYRDDARYEEYYEENGWRPRYYTGFHFYYPWRTSFYWGTVWYSDPFFWDPWYWDWYSPWYARWYSPYYYYPHSYYYGYWYPRSYFYGGYYPGYYAYYQPYNTYDRTKRRESGYRRSGDTRRGTVGIRGYQTTSNQYPSVTRRAGTSRGSGSSDTEVTRRTESTDSRSRSGYTRRPENSSREGSSRGSSYQPRSRESQSSSGTRRSGSERSSQSRGRDQSSYRSPSSSSPPPSTPAPSTSRGNSDSGGSNRSSGAKRGNR